MSGLFTWVQLVGLYLRTGKLRSNLRQLSCFLGVVWKKPTLIDRLRANCLGTYWFRIYVIETLEVSIRTVVAVQNRSTLPMNGSCSSVNYNLGDYYLNKVRNTKISEAIDSSGYVLYEAHLRIFVKLIL